MIDYLLKPIPEDFVYFHCTTDDAAKFEDIILIREYVRRNKAQAAYTPAIGEQLGIIGLEEDDDMESKRPEITSCIAYPGYVRKKFKKMDLMPLIFIQD